jgi:hypothetical protein
MIDTKKHAGIATFVMNIAASTSSSQGKTIAIIFAAIPGTSS